MPLLTELIFSLFVISINISLLAELSNAYVALKFNYDISATRLYNDQRKKEECFKHPSLIKSQQNFTSILAIDAFAAMCAKFILEIFRIFVVARIDAHHDTAVFDTFFIRFRAVFRNPCAD